MPTTTLTSAEVLEALAAARKTAWLQDFVLSPAQEAHVAQLRAARWQRVAELQAAVR